jgi:hypothetical protein
MSFPNLIARTKQGGVYLGVGPEQNFTYMAAIRPGIAIITDIRRGNLHMQLMYKALFELSADRGEFVSRLFSKPRPPTVTTSSTVAELFDAFWEVPTVSEGVFNANVAAIQRHLTKTHAIPLSQDDLDGIARVYKTFYWYGPSMNYSASVALTAGGQGRGTNYRDLMVQTDATGQGFSYLGSEEKFAFPQTTGAQESGHPRRRQFLRTEGSAGGGRVSEIAPGDGHSVLSVERGVVPAARRHMDGVLRQCRDVPAR